MIPITIPNRPFAAEPITGLMLPDGVFEASFGLLQLHAQFQNLGATPISDATIYIESVSDPGVAVVPHTYYCPAIGSVARLLSWEADFSAATPGVQRVSFIVDVAGSRTRIIKKIFVTRIGFDATTKTFHAATPEGVMEVRLTDLARPLQKCCRRQSRSSREELLTPTFVNQVSRLAAMRILDPNFEFCLPGYLLHDMEVVVRPVPPYAGQYGDLPFQDFWWKIILALIALILIIAAAVEGSKSGDEITTGTPAQGGNEVSTGEPPNCCGVEEHPAVQGGGNSYLVGGLVAAAAAVVVVAAYSDIRDPFRRGEDHTAPAQGEVTTAERLVASIAYPEPVALGRPFAVGVSWRYTRITTGASHTYLVKDEVNVNAHVLSSYKITAPNVIRVYKREPFVIKGEFRGPNGDLLTGAQLRVQCVLRGPANQYRSFSLQDDGVSPDEISADGIYTGVFQFALEKEPLGLWMIYVIAQDINTAQPEMTPEQQSQIIGGMILTHQVTISFDGGTCPLVPDGHVNVV